MVEGCLLSFTGAALGLGVAVAGVRALIAAYPDSLPRSADVTLDLGVLAFTLVIGLATGAVFGLAPLLHLAPDATSLALKEGGTRTTAGAGRNRIRRGARRGGSGARRRARHRRGAAAAHGDESLERRFRLQSRPARHVRGHAAERDVCEVRAGADASIQRLLEQLRSTAGVQSVAAMTGSAAAAPGRRQRHRRSRATSRRPTGRSTNVDYYQTVTTGYVETMGIPVVEGRAFQPTDALATTVLINETMARTFYKGQSPIGRRVKPSGGQRDSVVHHRRRAEGREAGRRRQEDRHRAVFQLRAADHHRAAASASAR